MFPLVFGAIFLTVGLIPIWLAVRTFAKDRAIARWPRAPGRMTVSRVSSYTSSEKDQQGYYRRCTYHDPVVEYTYTVGGRELVGKQLTRVAVSSTSMPDLSRYPEGQDVSVYYDPNDPTIAYLEMRRSIGAIILCILGGAFVVPGILVPVLVLSCGA